MFIVHSFQVWPHVSNPYLTKFWRKRKKQNEKKISVSKLFELRMYSMTVHHYRLTVIGGFTENQNEIMRK